MQVQDYFTYAKMFALIIISITGLVQLGHGRTEFFTFENSETDVTVIALSFYSGLFSYTGWNYLNFIIEEMKVTARRLVIKELQTNHRKKFYNHGEVEGPCSNNSSF